MPHLRLFLSEALLHMRITNTPPTRPTERSKKAGSSSSSSGVDFKGFLSGTDEASGAHEAQPAQGVNSFLFLQEVSDEEVHRQKALQHGKTALQALEQLHRDLLLGRIPETTLRKLEQTVAQRRETFTDPRLSALLDEIELRVAVELAKLDRA